MRTQCDTADAAIAEIARRQHGIVSVEQLRAAGLGSAAVTRRVRAGRLHRIHRGVYAVGHLALSQHARWMAASMACGPTAVVSHRSAAALWGLLAPQRGPVDVTVPGISGRRRLRGLRIHRSRTLTPADATRHHRIPITTPARTIEDLRRTAPAAVVRRAARQAAVLGLGTGDDHEVGPTRSDLERDFIHLCRRHGLPRPEVNVRIGGLEVDFLWRDRRLIVETDGYRYHRGRAAFEDDRARDLRLTTLGYEVIRLSYRQVTSDDASVATVLRQKLAPSPP